MTRKVFVLGLAAWSMLLGTVAHAQTTSPPRFAPVPEAQRTPEQQDDLLRIAYEGDYRRPTCASCGIKMVERSPKKVRDTYKDFFTDLPGTGYDFYKPPVPVEIGGSLFFDVTHATGQRPGPKDLRPGMTTSAEIIAPTMITESAGKRYVPACAITSVSASVVIVPQIWRPFDSGIVIRNSSCAVIPMQSRMKSV